MGRELQATTQRQRMMLQASFQILLAIEVLLFAAIVFCYGVLRVTWGEATHVANRVGDPMWTLLCGAALVGGSALIWFAAKAAQSHQTAAVGLVGLTCMYGIIALATRVIDLGGRPEPFVLTSADIPGYVPPKAVRATAKPTAASAGNAEKGKPFYLATCAACHGPNGQGIAGTAPAYSDTDFVSKSDETSLARMIQRGRPITDPANKSKRAMPASGGNPFLTPQNLRDIAAYIKNFKHEAPAAGAAQPAGPQLPNWVVPGAALGSLGLRGDVTNQWSAAQLVLADESDAMSRVERRSAFLSGLIRVWSGIHVLHLAAAAIGLIALFGQAIASGSGRMSFVQVSAMAVWWYVGTIAWFVSFCLFHLLG